MTDDGNGGNKTAISETEPAGKDADEVLEILKQRASTLAKKKTATNSEELLEIVRFIIDGQSYAFEVGQLREVCTLSQITKVPCSQDFIVGVINLRGQIIPIADIRTFMNIPGHGPPVFNKAIIIENDDVSIGILADEVVRAEKVPLSTIQKVLTSMSGVTAECLRGITRDKTFLLDVPQILSSPRLYAGNTVDSE